MREKLDKNIANVYTPLSGTFVRDKDGVNDSIIICEMFAYLYYKEQGKVLVNVLQELYIKFDYYQTRLHSVIFEGESGFYKM